MESLPLSPDPKSAVTAQPLYIPVDYRVLRQLIIPLGEEAFPGMFLRAVDNALLQIIPPRLNVTKVDQQIVFVIFFNVRKLWRQNQIDPETSYFVTTDGKGTSFSLTRDWDPLQGKSKESFFKDSKLRRLPQDWNNFQRGHTMLHNGIQNFDLTNERVFGIDPG